MTIKIELDPVLNLYTLTATDGGREVQLECMSLEEVREIRLKEIYDLMEDAL